MKKILFSAIAAIGLLLSPGCSDENEVVSGGNDSLVSFSVGLENGIQTKAISDGTRAQNLVVGVYENIGDSYEEIPALRSKDQTFNVGPDGKPKAAVTFNLVKGKTYSFIFWAQAQPVDGTADKPFDIRDLRDIKVDYSAANCNDEARDAFVGVVKDLKVSGTYEKEVTLKRPFAQLNFLVTKEELEAADNSTNLELKKSQITLSKAATVLQPFTNTVDGFTEAAVTFQPTAIPMLSDEYNNANSQTHPKVGDPSTTDTYYYLATTYFLVPAAGNSNDAGKARTTLSSVNLKLANDEGTQAEGPGFTAHTVPVQWNYRTNIYGSLLTADGQFNVEIVPSFNTENNVEQPQTVMVATVDEVNNALANGATSVTVQNAPTENVSLNIPKRFEQGNEATVELTIPTSSYEITIGYGGQTNAAPKYVALNVPNTQNLTIDLEYSTVTLNGENYNEVTATTWDNTLIVPVGTTIQTLHVIKGNVEIYGTVNNITKANDYTGTIYYSIAPGVMKANEDYYIKNAQGLLWFREQASTTTLLKGKTIKLMADIDMNDLLPQGSQIGDANWTSFSSFEDDNLGQSTIDGNGHTIKNMVIKSLMDGGYGCGFLANTNGNITIKNLTFDHADVTTGRGDYSGNIVGIVVGYNYATATFDNVTVKNSRVNGFGKVGVLLGMAADPGCKVVFKNCKTVGNQIEAVYNAGGLAGNVQRKSNKPNNITIENCTVDNTFVPLEGQNYVTLDTTVSSSDSGDVACPGSGTNIKGLYWDAYGVFWGAYGEYCVSYGWSPEQNGHDCTLEGNSKKLANGEIVLNKDWTPVQNN